MGTRARLDEVLVHMSQIILRVISRLRVARTYNMSEVGMFFSKKNGRNSLVNAR